MPTVPYIDQAAMPAPQYSAPGVAPVRNAAPEQIGAMGEALGRVGEFEYKTGQTIGNALADQVDEATVKQAVTAFHAGASDLLNNAQTGYLHSLGQAAINGAGSTKQAILKAQQDGLSGMNNPLQKKMFLQATDPAMTEFGTAIDNHNYAQTTQYAGESALNLAQTATASAAQNHASYGYADGAFNRYVATVENQTRHAALIMKGAPAGTPNSDKAVLDAHSAVAMGTLSQMMDARTSAARVQQVFDDMRAKDWLNLDTLDTLGRAVKTYTEQENQRTNSVQFLSNQYRASHGLPTTSTGTPDYGMPAKGAAVTAQPYDADEGAVALNLPQGSYLQAPADGKVIAVGKDENGTFGMGIQHPDGSVTTLSGIADWGVKVGDEVQKGESLATASPTVLWSLADKNGNRVDPTKTGLPPVDLSKIIDEKDLDSALTAMREHVTDPLQQQQTANEMITTVKRNQQEDNVRKTQNYSAADDAFSPTMNWKNIPPPVFNALTPTQQRGFQDRTTEYVLRQYNQGQAFKEMSETDLVSDFINRPDQLTPENVEKARPQLARSTYLSLMRQANEQRANPGGVVEAQGVNDRIKYYGIRAGLNVDGSKLNLSSGKMEATKETPEDKQRYIDITKRVNDAIDQIKMQNKGKATAAQVDEVIKQQLIQTTVVTPRSSTTRYNFQAPEGAVGTAIGSDKHLYYVDASGKIVGSAE